jgi:regulator of PEP synthase PpsR (kinase-PPPase family)
MTPSKLPVRSFHLYLVSDATGETLNSIAKATCAQFADIQPIQHVFALVRSPKQLSRVLGAIEDEPGLVMFTLMNPALRAELETRCLELNIPFISVLDDVLGSLERYLGAGLTHKPGGQHEMNEEYFRRMEALAYTMHHDDGQMTEELDLADVVLIGISRTSKTPTCIYLANRGIKAANVPIVPNIPLPDIVEKLTKPLVIGLTATPDRLVQIRRNRLISLNQDPDTEYVNMEAVREETVFARKLFARNDWPIIDVTRRSVEETAAAVYNLYTERRDNQEESDEDEAGS